MCNQTLQHCQTCTFKNLLNISKAHKDTHSHPLVLYCILSLFCLYSLSYFMGLSRIHSLPQGVHHLEALWEPPVAHQLVPKMPLIILVPDPVRNQDQSPGKMSLCSFDCMSTVTKIEPKSTNALLLRSRSRRSSRRHHSRSRSRSYRRRSRSRSRSWRRRRSHSRSPMSNRRRHIGNRVCTTCIWLTLNNAWIRLPIAAVCSLSK